MKLKYLLGSVVAASASFASAAFAETVLRLDEVAVGELDPAKASDYADSILMFNVYDTLVLPNQGGPGHSGHLAESWTSDGATFTFNLRDGVNFQSGNSMSAKDVVYSLERSQALGSGQFDKEFPPDCNGGSNQFFTILTAFLKRETCSKTPGCCNVVL